MTATPADVVYAQAADLFGGSHDQDRTLTRDWNTARRSHRRLRPALVGGLLAAARAQTPAGPAGAA